MAEYKMDMGVLLGIVAQTGLDLKHSRYLEDACTSP
jgi:hypothetical protein